MGFRYTVLLAVASVFGAHFLTYFLINILPDAAIVSLGLESARQEVVAAFQADHEKRSYIQVLIDLLVHFQLGTTLDGLPVAEELLRALAESSGRVLGGMLVVIAACFLVAFYASEDDKKLYHLFSFLSFLPPYLIPFLGIIIILFMKSSTNTAIAEGIAVITISTVPAALVTVQAMGIMRRNLKSDFALTLKAIGAGEYYRRFKLLPNLFAEIIPSLEKMFILMMTTLLFAEPVLGINGFGTMTIRAIRRSDPDLLLGVVIILSFTVGLCRLAAFSVRRHYGLTL